MNLFGIKAEFGKLALATRCGKYSVYKLKLLRETNVETVSNNLEFCL